MYTPASRSVSNSPPSGKGIGLSNSALQLSDIRARLKCSSRIVDDGIPLDDEHRDMFWGQSGDYLTRPRSKRVLR
jgi:hypothetical protein